MISETQYEIAAYLLDCEVEVIKAVAAVESNGSGFNKDGTLKILFEPHIFYKQLIAHRITPLLYANKTRYHDIIYERWGQRPYGKPSQQWDRLKRAAEINREAAYKSASWGKFQIMGFNHKAAGYDTVLIMVNRLLISEDEHLMSFVKLIKSWGLDSALRAKDWAIFASGYNGPGYKNSSKTILDDYDYKMKTMYKKLVKA